MSDSALLSRKGLSFERLAAFVAVAEAKGIAAAAPEDAVRQSQLSRQVSELETALEVPLFHRVRRRLELNENGRRLLALAREFSQGLVQLSGAPVPLVLGAGDSVLQWLVVPNLGLFNDASPIQLRALDGPQLVRGLVDHELDLAVMAESDVSDGLLRTVVGRVEYAMFSAGKRRAAPRPLAVVTGEPRLRRALQRLGSAALECETFPQVARAVETGRYRGVLPTFASVRISVSIERLRALDECSTRLAVVWNARSERVRPELARLRERWVRGLRLLLNFERGSVFALRR